MIALVVALSLTGAWPRDATIHRALWRSEWVRAGLAPEHRERLAAQVEVESAWRPDAVSPAGAVGIAQFMAGTQKLMDRAYSRQLAGLGGRRSVRWSFRAMFLLMSENLAAFQHRWKYAASAYNGGPGYLRRERRAAGGSWDWETVRAHCRSFRSAPACRENVEYPAKIEARETAYRGY